MAVDEVRVGQATDDTSAITVTLRGKTTDVVEALVHGLPREALMQLRDECTLELEARHATKPDDA